jgi:hypothetical protein
LAINLPSAPDSGANINFDSMRDVAERAALSGVLV